VYATVVSVTVGVRKFRENLKEYLDRAKAGEEVVITERGRRIARLIGASKLDQLIAEGRVRPAKRRKTPVDLDRLPVLDGPPTLSDVVIRDKQ
jgi:prevent-host-death family protein